MAKKTMKKPGGKVPDPYFSMGTARARISSKEREIFLGMKVEIYHTHDDTTTHSTQPLREMIKLFLHTCPGIFDEEHLEFMVNGGTLILEGEEDDKSLAGSRIEYKMRKH